MSSEGDWKHLSNAVHKVMRALESKGIVHAEAFLSSTEALEVTIRNSEVFTQNKGTDSGVGFRIAVAGNRVGFACTNAMNEKTILETGERAFSIAKASSRVPHFAFPEVGKPSRVKDLFDPRVAEIEIEGAVDIAERAIEAAEDYDRGIIAKDGRVLFESARVGVMNTLGVDLEEPRTQAIIYLGGSGERKGEVTGSCYDVMFSRTADLEPERIGENVARKVVRMFNPKPLKGFEGTVIFAPEAVSYQIVDVLVDSLKGENVVSGRSAWAHSIGQSVGSQSLAVTDNATLKRRFPSRSFDDEGYPSQSTLLIKDGELKSFLHDTTTANALKTKSTGNASRSPKGFNLANMIIGSGYRTAPQISVSNLMIHPGGKSKEQLVSEVRKGVLIESMAGFPQAGSGLISAQLSQAFFIQGGEVKYPVKSGMVSGVVFDWLKQIASIGSDFRQFQNAVVPSLQIEGVKVAGA